MYEIEQFGVKATLVEPSLSRRDEYVYPCLFCRPTMVALVD